MRRISGLNLPIRWSTSGFAASSQVIGGTFRNASARSVKAGRIGFR